MLFYWLRLLARRIAWLFVPPTARDVGRVRADAPCPVCGSREGALRCVVMKSADEAKNGRPPSLILCQHTCSVCGARFYEKPVLKVTPQIVFPAIARTEQEKREDAIAAFAAMPEQQKAAQ